MCICYLYIFFGEMSVKVLGLFFNCVVYFLIVECKEFMYILDDSLLSDLSFANIFS